MMMERKIQYFSSARDLTRDIKQHIKETEIVLDIGPGIYPFNLFVPKYHILIEPWEEYVSILRGRFAQDSQVLIIKCDALTIARCLDDNSVDSVVLIDVIEHLEKEEGLDLIKELERITRQQIVIFTPLGFMPQHVEPDRSDRWGLGGGQFQEHLSGWTPADFDEEWNFFVCEEFHLLDDFGNSLVTPFGAFYAVKNFLEKEIKAVTEYEGTFFRKTPKDLVIENLTSANANLESQIQNLTSANTNLESQIQNLTSANANLESRLHHIKSDYDKSIERYSHLLNENWTIINSNSWKVTRGFRFLSKYIQRVKRTRHL